MGSSLALKVPCVCYFGTRALLNRLSGCKETLEVVVGVKLSVMKTVYSRRPSFL